MSSQDPLTLLRNAVISKTLPELRDASGGPCDSLLQAHSLAFSSASSSEPITLNVTTPTRFTSEPNKADVLLTLQQLLYVVLAKDASSAEYMRNANVGGTGFRPIGILDRRVVLEYLTGGQAPAGRVLVEGIKPEEEAVFEGDVATQAGPDVSADAGQAASTSATQPGGAGGAAGGAPAAKRKYEVNEADKEAVKRIRAKEISLLDKYDTLRVAPGGKKADFTALRRAIVDERIIPLRQQLNPENENGTRQHDSAPSSRARSSSVASSSVSSAQGGAKKQRATTQNIILLSSSPTALISMWNVKRFLEEGVFERTADARARQVEMGNRKMEDIIVIYHQRSGKGGGDGGEQDKPMKYYVIDNVEVLSKLAGSSGQDPWDRVVAVFTTGQMWQFKQYKWQDPKVLFRHVRGVYMHYTNDPINAAVQDWKVHSFGINPQQRHTDRPVVASFWNMIEGVGKR